MKRGIVGVCSPFRGEGDSCVCGCVYGKGKAGSIIHRYLLGVISFITDFYTAIARCAGRSGGFQCYHGFTRWQRIRCSGFGKIGFFATTDLIGQLI